MKQQQHYQILIREKCRELHKTEGRKEEEEEDYSFHYGPACVAFRMLGLVQGPYTEDGIQSLKPVAKTSAPGLSLCHLSIPPSNQNHLENIWNSSEFSFHSSEAELTHMGNFV